ncbi:lipocalin-like domain-containing protein [Ferruginibacter sp.]
MKKIITLLIIITATAQICTAQSPAGKWKRISYTVVYEGTKMDTHAALLTQRPCAANIVYEFNADGTYRLNAAGSGCDENYKKIQEKLYSKTKWQLTGNSITIYAVSVSLGHTHTVSFNANKMTLTNKDETIVYQKL